MTRSAVLVSGGLDSAVLLAMEIASGSEVLPIYVRSGLAWEAAEQATLDRLLAGSPFAGRTQPVTSLDVDMRDVYPPSHWALGHDVPGFDAPDADVYLAGRNIVLTTKAGILAAGRGFGRLVLGPLAGNPFPDATPAFFAAMATALSVGLDQPLSIEAPFVTLSKADVIRTGSRLAVPLEHTLSCLRPLDGDHCGACNKCRERQDAFAEASVVDRTRYRTGATS